MAGDDIADLMPLIESRWDSVPLGNVTVFVNGDRGKNYPSQSDYVSRGVPFISAADLMDGRVDAGNCTFITEAAFDRLGGGKTKEGDLLFCLRGSLGKVARIRSIPRGAIASSLVIIRATDQADRDYLYYILSGPLGQRFAAELNNGSVQPNISARSLKESCIPLPPLAEQKAIAAVLGSLDDKIELNRLMNATLEAMARALFQSWFVDFDPVRAKLAGRIPVGMDDITAALFSSTFQESSLGHVPNGWTVGNFGHVVAAARERIGDSEAVVLSAVSSSNLVRSDEHFNKQVYSKSISNYLKVRRWDFAYNPSRINIGSIGMLKESVVGAVSPVYEVFRPSATYHWFVERALAQPDVKIWIQTLCSGSVRQSLKLRDLASIPLVIPHPSVVQAFNKTWEQWHELIQKNEKESRTLATLRDTLLPKLLSGELSVAEATGNRDFQVQPGMPKP